MIGAMRIPAKLRCAVLLLLLLLLCCTLTGSAETTWYCDSDSFNGSGGANGGGGLCVLWSTAVVPSMTSALSSCPHYRGARFWGDEVEG